VASVRQKSRYAFAYVELYFKQEGIAVGRTFAALKNYQVDGNKEMMAIGLMNVIGSATSCYVTTGANIYSLLSCLSFVLCY
jgi:MFS superfamily sulfate permease-like transporter